MVKDYYGELKKEFPKEAYSKDSSRGFDLTSIKAQYIVERLNDVFGIFGWRISGEFKQETSGVLYIGQLIICADDKSHSIEAIGFSSLKKNIGDSYKSARTDALGKAASLIGVGNEVFKGNVDPSGASKNAPQKTVDEFEKGIVKLFNAKLVSSELIITKINENFSKAKLADLNSVEKKRLLIILNEHIDKEGSDGK